MEKIKDVAVSYASTIWDEKDLSAVDEWVDRQCVIHSSLGDFHGPEAMKKIVQAWLIAFPDLVVINKHIITENDIVMIHWEAGGTHQGEFKGIKPKGKRVAYQGVTLYRIAQGKIIEYWAFLDMNHLLGQIK